MFCSVNHIRIYLGCIKNRCPYGHRIHQRVKKEVLWGIDDFIQRTVMYLALRYIAVRVSLINLLVEDYFQNWRKDSSQIKN